MSIAALHLDLQIVHHISFYEFLQHFVSYLITQDSLDFINSVASHASVQMSLAETLVFWSVCKLAD